MEVKDLFKRADLQQIIYFLMHGKECGGEKNTAYADRIHKVSIEILQKVQGLNLNSDRYEEITDEIYSAFKVYEEVYTEIGLKMGARIFFQLICEDEKYSLIKLF